MIEIEVDLKGADTCEEQEVENRKFTGKQIKAANA